MTSDRFDVGVIAVDHRWDVHERCERKRARGRTRPPMISLLVVNFRSAALAAARCAARVTPRRCRCEVVIVDNSGDARETDALRGVADRLVVAEANRGYAGGINLGRRACHGDVIVISNPTSCSRRARSICCTTHSTIARSSPVRTLLG
jgi:hypothetical protein